MVHDHRIRFHRPQGLAAAGCARAWVGWLATFLVYQATFVGLMHKRWINASAERARGTYD